ncbi:MAG: hypothetical protein AAGU76_01170 [Sedimentibacter sp.]|uniref:hypothetical protein n=1 Tax=Sedimentibacter sp. TaxID=1960295 RepID=UPI00315859E8
MSKGNGRHNTGKGNGMDKFNGSCNGIFSSTDSRVNFNHFVNRDSNNLDDSKKDNHNDNQLKKEFENKR